MHSYALDLQWIGNTGEGTTSYRSYSREFRVTIAGKPDLVGSADPTFRGDAARHNPEEMLVVALSSCHMLSYLALCARHGVRVETYRDAARGRMVTIGNGGHFEEVTLAPRVGIAEASDPTVALELHERAHADCYIASSCNFPIRCEPEIVVERAPDPLPPRRDLAVRLADRAGALAEFGEVLGRAGVSLEGGGGFTVGDGSIVHFLVSDAARASDALRAAGIDVIGTRDVVVHRLAQGTPGQLGAFARAMADAGVNIESVYSDHDHQLIVGVDDNDLDAARRVSAAWGRVK
jgi:organic hydroperoxide reductase OsmC/OhrA